MKQKTVFLCGDCGYESPKWYGKCPSCGAWNTMSEFKEKPVSAARGTNTFSAANRGRLWLRKYPQITAAASCL